MVERDAAHAPPDLSGNEPARTQAGRGSPLRDALVEIVKAALVSEPEFGAACRERAMAALRQHEADEIPAGAWALAVREVESDPEMMNRVEVNPTLPATCPIDLRTLGSPDFDFDRAAQAIRESASFG
ncbi:hypothetical protein [Enterovirga aerilata]|uniref:Uncharacterized protein n=1 Tax=Enterovirga aerilata TaxID=2730920 RepID=A0A849I9H4_9HYPH|nr:hypothetical protein [Enterovirga sp. DB1703]NNM74038.1 hypothetical protein [Enterovirga sp. DB1703]